MTYDKFIRKWIRHIPKERKDDFRMDLQSVVEEAQNNYLLDSVDWD